MRQMRWASWLAVGALAVVIGGAQDVQADVASDRAAAIVKYPWVTSADGISDTVIQLSNVSREAPIDVHCFYINANPHCTNTGEVCFSAEECCGENGCGICLPGWNETDFHIRLTPLQPIAWLANEGLDDFPIDGVIRVGSDGSSNAGSRIPPVPEDPFIGELKCIAVSPEGFPIDRNVLKGEATLETFLPGEAFEDDDDEDDLFDVAKYNAIGIQAIEGAVNDDNVLVLGGEGAEYNGCPNVTIVNHFSDWVKDPATDGQCEFESSEEGEGPADREGCIVTRLVLVPCAQDLLRQLPGSAVVQYLVYNEFEQRFSTSRTVRCQQALLMSEIDTTQPLRSIFSAAVLGTVTAQTRLTPIGSGLVGVAIESHADSQLGDDDDDDEDDGDFVRSGSAAFNLHFQGDRPDSDLIILP